MYQNSQTKGLLEPFSRCLRCKDNDNFYNHKIFRWILDELYGFIDKSILKKRSSRRKPLFYRRITIEIQIVKVVFL